ncbi:Crp/Fnr family transcriptional regulator [Paraburkholderia silviterrae]|uniref:Crp/Fnr family transcriptional regulator n=2 Tax=Paraburkholderia silviterrae TaxID=2528715 RepID=A0A4R5LYG0_9BURK|nr:Crp/Fnr family transcriptional regulator [Paraburkholderia silviterrae]
MPCCCSDIGISSWSVSTHPVYGTPQRISVNDMTDSNPAALARLIANVLQRAAWFQDCSAASLQAIQDHGSIKRLGRGEMLMRCGEAVGKLNMVLDGALEVSATSATGKRHVTNYLEPGQLIGLIPFIDEGGSIHDVTAHENSLVLQLDRALFERLTAAEPALTRCLMRTLCLRSRRTYARLTDSLLLPLRQRCAQTLLELVSPYGVPAPQGVAISLKLSQEELADMIGCSRPMANRELKELEKEGAISMTYSRYSIIDIERLRAIAAGH